MWVNAVGPDDVTVETDLPNLKLPFGQDHAVLFAPLQYHVECVVGAPAWWERARGFFSLFSFRGGSLFGPRPIRYSNPYAFMKVGERVYIYYSW